MAPATQSDDDNDQGQTATTKTMVQQCLHGVIILPS